MDVRKIHLIAAACHMANRAVCLAQGDGSQVPWEDAPAWQRESAIEGVRQVLKGSTPKDLHVSWCAAKERDGWKYGATKDPEAKTHPCLVPYEQLSEGQRLKDDVFLSVVTSLGKVLAVSR